MISLVIPIFNMKQFLPRCMEKFLRQKGDYEIILIDDGSTDGSRELCDWYASEYSALVRVVHKENGGLSSARNTGIDAAQGEYVTFPDPDDWVELNFIERLTTLQEQYTPDLLCIGHYIDFDNQSVSANERQPLKQMNKNQAQKALLIPPSMNGFAWNKLYHMDIIQSHQLRFLDDVGTTEDLDFAYRYLQFCKKIIFSPEDRLYHYYQRNGAATHSGFSQKKVEAIRTYEKIIATATDKEMIRAAEEEICNTAINLVWSFRESHIEDEEIWRQLRQYLGQHLKYYCTSQRYGIGRKVQAILAYYTPKLYVYLKRRINKEKI